MRIRPRVALVGVVVAAAFATALVVWQLPREGQVSPAPPLPVPPPSSPPDAPASPGDGAAVVRVTAGGEPQAGASVQLYRAVVGAVPAWRRAGAATAGPDGIAQVPARAGAYLAAIRAAGLAPGYAEVLRATGEAESRVEVELAPPAALEGVVHDRDGRPIAARTTLVPAAAARLGAGLGAPEEETLRVNADGTGRFHAGGLAPGTWAMTIEAPGFHALRVEPVAVPRAGPLELTIEPLATLAGEIFLPGDRAAARAAVRAVSRAHLATATADAAGRFSIALPAGEYALLASAAGEAGALTAPVTSAPGAAVRGVAVRLGPAATVEGAVVLGDGAPASGAGIELVRHDTGGRAASATADAGGRFALDGLAPGPYDLRASAPDASPTTVAGITLAAGQRAAVRVTLAARGAVEGTVADAAGAPLSGARVRVLSRGDGLEGVLPIEVHSDFEGRYRITGVEAGRAELVAAESSALLGDVRAVRIEPGRTSRADFVVPAAGLLSGRVTAGGRRPPLGTAVVAVPLRAGLGTSQVARTLADASGNYGLAVPAGEYRVHAAPAEVAYADLRIPPAFVRVEPRLTTRLDLALAPAPAEEGPEVAVIEPGGAPSPGAIVTLSRPDDAKIALALTAGEDGRVRLGAGLVPGGAAVVLRVRNGGRSGAYTGPLPASGTLVVPLAPGGALDGIVRGGGRTVRGFTLEVSSRPTPEGWRTVDVHRFTGDRFALGDLPSEPLRLLVRTDDGRRGEADVRLAAGETRGLEISLADAPVRR
ncbi:carboxypeptidase-like regulatory domain-containing protein [Anaeromyxobacter oryzisoli]|uniref:carboxypeptidase-like regulatory domain-containing protein n=1 Tax=Anaeromyxobacter oryzisoli TaxID=2925408 RepID=UPI001F5AA737|nr:carboxypeptidase-like regulatory domain-containing protein [Anaeromyxobacter sp. SG63]